MPYYRIIIWTKRRKQPFTGIRFITNPNINGVYNMAYSKANQTYSKDLIDVEVQMLSKLCTAVKEIEKKGSPIQQQ
jgi:hypothetical protein